MTVRYVCALRNAKHGGDMCSQLFYTDDTAADTFARQWDGRPGIGIYDCIGGLRDGATARNKEEVTELAQLIVDLDLKDIVESREEVLDRLRGLVLPPSEIRDSGFGLHSVWDLKEPVTDDAGLAQAENAMGRLVVLLAGDPAPTHRAALLRRPGTHNTKEGDPRPCHVIERTGATYDISEFEDLFDLYGDRLLLQGKPRGNGGGATAGAAVDLEEMVASDGASVNATYCQAIPERLRAGEHPNEVLRDVVDAAMAAAARENLPWDRKVEVKRVVGTILSQYRNLDILLHGYDPLTGAIPDCLPGEFHESWVRVLEAGRRPTIGYNAAGFFVKGLADKGPAGSGATGGGEPPNEEPKGEESKEKERAGKRVLVLQPFVPFDPATLPPRQFLYAKHYQRRTVSLTAGPGGIGKSSLDNVEAVANATCRNLLGEQPTERLRVWLHNGEDPREEILRRIAAICQHYKIPQEELRGQLWITSGNEFPLRVAKGYANLEINEVLVRQISNAIGDNRIDVAIFDPLVTLHSVSEGDPGKMDAVIRLFAGIADEHDAAIELNHHVRKPAAGADADFDVHDIRGVMAITDAVRAARVLNRMSKADADNAGIDEIARLMHFRVDKAKGNYTPAQAATWRRFVSVDLPNTDSVGVVEPWDFPGQGTQTPEKAAADQQAEQVFLQLLDKFLARGVNVNSSGGANYAPNKFASEREATAAKVSKAALKAAMTRLLDAGRIRAESTGRADRPSHRLVPWQGEPK